MHGQPQLEINCTAYLGWLNARGSITERYKKAGPALASGIGPPTSLTFRHPSLFLRFGLRKLGHRIRLGKEVANSASW